MLLLLAQLIAIAAIVLFCCGVIFSIGILIKLAKIGLIILVVWVICKVIFD